MRVTPAALAAGVAAAVRVPVYLRGMRLRALMEPPTSGTHGAEAPRGAVGAAYRCVALLARVPGLPWRNTCLYRSVAECLVLRRYGVPAYVRIGVRNEDPPHGAIVAHAWVVRTTAEDGVTTPGPNELIHALLGAR